MPTSRTAVSLLLAAIAALFFVPFLGGVHLFDWDEINFAECAREMLLTGNYSQMQINFQPFFEKPPLFIWMQVLSMKLFGVGEFAARLPNAVAGIVALPVLYNIGRTVLNHRFGLLWAGSYFGSVLGFLYFKSGIIDPWLNLFLMLALWNFVRYYWKHHREKHAESRFASVELKRSKWFYLAASALFLGLATILKGQISFVILLAVLGIYWIYQRLRWYASPVHIVLFLLVALIVPALWLVPETIINGPTFISEFITYQIRLLTKEDAGHGGFFGYHFVVLLVGCFPASVFAIRALFKMGKSESAPLYDFTRWMKILFWVVLILFSIVQSKIVHYSSLCYYPLSFLAALCIHNLLEHRITFNKWMKAGIWTVGGLFVLATVAMPIFAKNIEWIKPLFEKDEFALANLQADVAWSGTETTAGIFLLLLMFGFFALYRHTPMRAFYVLFAGVGVFVMLTLGLFVGRIEGYSQRAAIEFFQQRQGEDCYVLPMAYKSYAYLFYSNKQVPELEEALDKDWLLKGPIDKPVYAITKITKLQHLSKYPEFQLVGGKNGWVFFKREVPR